MELKDLLKALVDLDEGSRKELIASLEGKDDSAGLSYEFGSVDNVCEDPDSSQLSFELGKSSEWTVNGLPGKASGITKEMVKEASEKKGLTYKASDNHVEVNTALSVKANSSKAGRDGYRPTKAQLAVINKMALEPQTEESGYVFELQMADQEIDRAYEHFTSEAITDMAKLSPGKPVLLDHSWSAKSIVGRIFKAKNDAGKLVQWAYFPETEGTKAITEGILSGMLNKLSVGFAIDYENMICDSCKNCIYDWEKCDHYPGGKDEEGKTVTITLKRVKDYHESSIIPVPCQPDSHIRLSYDPEKLAEASKKLDPALTNFIESMALSGKTFNRELFKGAGLVGGIVPIPGEKEAGDTIALGNNNTIQDSVMADEKLEAPAQEVEGTEEVATPDEAPEAPAQEEAPAAEPAKEAPKAEAQVKLELPAELTNAFVELSKAVESLQKGMEALDKKVDLAMTAPTEGLKALLAKEVAEEDEEEAPQTSWLYEKFFDQGEQK